MFNKIFAFFLLSFSFYSCFDKDNQKPEQPLVKKTSFNVVISHKAPLQVNSFSEKKIKNWKTYSEVQSFLKRFENTSPNEAINNAIELKELIKELKEDNTIEEFKTNAFKSRINVLENEALRLADMTKIPAIKTNEVNNQIANILAIFGSLNAKINAIYLEQKIDTDLNFDTNKIVTPSKTIKKTPKKLLLKEKTIR